MTMKIPSLGSNLKEKILNSTFILFSFIMLLKFVGMFLTYFNYTDYQFSEFLINYQGGFVRRGLLGEILFFFAQNFNFNVGWAIKIISAACFIFVCVFFVKSFVKKSYSLYILPLCFFLGSGIFMSDWIRKDYMFLCFFILILCLYKSQMPTILKIITINVLAIFIILTHELFVFFSIPLLFVMFFSEYKNYGMLKSFFLSLLFLLPSILVTFFVVTHHGNQDVVFLIWNSWAEILNIDVVNIGNAVEGNSINALGGTTEYYIKKHLYQNFLIIDNQISSLLVWLITFPVIYYISTNALLVFRKSKEVFTEKHKTILSSVLVFQLLSLAPVFILLSCDYRRVFLFWIASSFAFFLLIPFDKIEKMFPKKFLDFVENINRFLANILTPTRTALVFLMLFIGLPRYGFAIERYYNTSVLYTVLNFLSMPIVVIKGFLINIF